MPPKLTVDELLLDESFIDYCRNDNSEHKSKWQQARAADPQLARNMDEAQELLQVVSPGLPPEEITAEIDKFINHFNVHVAPSTPANESKPRQKWLRNSLLAAAIITGCFLIINSYFFTENKPVQPAIAAITEHSTGLGERLKISLPDGSVVILNSNSRLQYNSDYNKEERRVELTGEAWFEVEPNINKRFSVVSDKFMSIAIGTAFYVHARQPADSYSVDLLEGKLQVQDDHNASMLKAGEGASWKTGDKDFAVNRFDSSSLRQWVTGRLSFEHAASTQVLDQLARWYAVDIQDLRKKTGTISITGDYSGKPLEDILKAICFSLSCKYTITQNKIIIQ